mmetsp:Transcript_38088/g.81302  ORF Transcript_38088/g.81302 Transcript_38088/m.81302 type:complete len:343 (+) Transcript_38088:1966-2994(+)
MAAKTKLIPYVVTKIARPLTRSRAAQSSRGYRRSRPSPTKKASVVQTPRRTRMDITSLPRPLMTSLSTPDPRNPLMRSLRSLTPSSRPGCRAAAARAAVLGRAQVGVARAAGAGAAVAVHGVARKRSPKTPREDGATMLLPKASTRTVNPSPPPPPWVPSQRTRTVRSMQRDTWWRPSTPNLRNRLLPLHSTPLIGRRVRRRGRSTRRNRSGASPAEILRSTAIRHFALASPCFQTWTYNRRRCSSSNPNRLTRARAPLWQPHRTASGPRQHRRASPRAPPSHPRGLGRGPSRNPAAVARSAVPSPASASVAATGPRYARPSPPLPRGRPACSLATTGTPPR